jgi:hypothetical protein
MIRGIHLLKAEMLHNSIPCMTDDIADEAILRYPQLVPILHNLGVDALLTDSLRGGSLGANRDNTWGETPLIYRNFIYDILVLGEDLPGFAEAASTFELYDNGFYCDLHDILSVPPTPWRVPTKKDVYNMADILGTTLRLLKLAARRGLFWSPDDSSKWRFSAASIAIHFLQSLPLATRTQIGEILLLEDRDSVAYPECHAQGLIPFCQENPMLRIERSVSLWRNAFLSTDLRESPEYRTHRQSSLAAHLVTKSVATWMVEACALEPLGMPRGAFTLVLVGNPTPEKTAQVFQTVQRDAAWQSALDESYCRSLVAPSYFRRQKNRCYHYEQFPQILQDMASRASVIRCTFDLGESMDIEQLLQDHRGWDAEQWDEAWKSHSPEEYHPGPPLPSWKEILAADVIPAHLMKYSD